MRLLVADWILRISDIQSVETLTLAEQQTNAENILAVLNGQLGWSLAAVAGVLGNAVSESYVNPGACETGRGIPRAGSLYYGGGLGLFQLTDYRPYIKEAVHPLLWYADQVSGAWWDGTLQCNLIDYCDDPSITSCGMGQGPRWGWMSTSTYPDSFSSFRTYQGTPEDAASIWLYNFERPASYSTENERRSQARYWYDYLQGMSPVPPTPVPPSPDPQPPTPPAPSRDSVYMPLWMMCRRPYLGER